MRTYSKVLGRKQNHQEVVTCISLNYSFINESISTSPPPNPEC